MIEQSSFVYLYTFTHLSVLQLCKQSVPAISATFKHDIGLVNLSTRCKYTLSSIIMCIFNWNKAYDNDIIIISGHIPQNKHCGRYVGCVKGNC